MKWQLDHQFDFQQHTLSKNLLIYHSGSGATHLLSGDSKMLFKLFIDQPDLKFSKDELCLRLLDIESIDAMLTKLQSLHLIQLIEE